MYQSLAEGKPVAKKPKRGLHELLALPVDQSRMVVDLRGTGGASRGA
jgi:hypothetical protein